MQQALPPSKNPHHHRRWLILVVIAIAQLLVVLDVTIVNIALPSAQQDLGFSDDDRQWVITAYALAFGSLLLLGGRIADLFGRKWAFIAGLVGFAGASALGGAAQSFELLVAARALQGVFAALLAPASLSLLSTTFTDPAERGRAFGIYAAIAGMGGAIGLLLGGALTEALDWRWCLYVSIVFAVPAAIAGTRLLHHVPAEARPRLDLPGALTASAGLFALVFGLARAESDGWGDPVTVAFVAGSAALLALFVGLQRRAAKPLLPLRVVTDRNRGASFLTIGTGVAGLYGIYLFLTFYLQDTKGLTALETGLAFLPLSLSILPTVGIVSRVLPRTGARPLVPAGLLTAALGMILLTRIGVDTNYATHVLPSPDSDRRRLWAGDGAGLRDRHLRRPGPRQWRRLGDGQHLAAGRRLDRDGAAEHARRVGDDRVHNHQRPGTRGSAPGGGRGLRDRVLVGGRHPRRRRPDLRGSRAVRRAARDEPRRAGAAADTHSSAIARATMRRDGCTGQPLRWIRPVTLFENEPPRCTEVAPQLGQIDRRRVERGRLVAGLAALARGRHDDRGEGSLEREGQAAGSSGIRAGGSASRKDSAQAMTQSDRFMSALDQPSREPRADRLARFCDGGWHRWSVLVTSLGFRGS
jgi:EmrB/QacA subfamily drug resistance transporter